MPQEPDDRLSVWTVYDHPRDWPDYYVAREWKLDEPTDNFECYRDLERLRRAMQTKGLVRLERNPGDDPVILETWL